MATESEARIGLAWKMTDHMCRKLRANESNGSWSSIPHFMLCGHLREELAELLDAVNTHKSPEAVWAEAADVANFAAMIADNYEKREGKG